MSEQPFEPEAEELDEGAVCSELDLVDFHRAIIELAGDYAHLPVIGIVGALHTAAHYLTTAAFDPTDEDEDEDDGDEVPSLGYAVVPED